VSFTVLIGLAAVSIDLGRARVAKSELQYVADARAMRRSSLLDGTADRQSRLPGPSVNTFASQAQVYGVVPTVDTVETGYWDGRLEHVDVHVRSGPGEGLKITLSATINYIGFSQVALRHDRAHAAGDGRIGEGIVQRSDAAGSRRRSRVLHPDRSPELCHRADDGDRTRPRRPGPGNRAHRTTSAWADQTSNPSSSVLSAQFNSLIRRLQRRRHDDLGREACTQQTA
jgi:hypothetical protein